MAKIRWQEMLDARRNPRKQQLKERKTKMKKLNSYRVYAMLARPVGSIGVMQHNMSVKVEAESRGDALIKAYDHLQDIHKPTVVLLTGENQKTPNTNS